jgi:hypothetical protein
MRVHATDAVGATEKGNKETAEAPGRGKYFTTLRDLRGFV